ncbi:MFS transporter [Actinomadura craniellae]|uniref:MFS transporter n=2 Tax=Actinomadura craniellae TaxID=2231787 RepID=A0A365H6I3_9ACTN|nr:MFS transporter [Actinomadura craniellae]
MAVEAFSTVLVLLVADRTGRAADAGFIVAAVLLPQVLAGPVIGDALDRVRRPRLLATGLAVAFTAGLALVLALAGTVPAVVIVVAAVLLGCTEPVVVAVSSLLPRLVPPARLTRAYGLESASYNVAGIVGPGLGAGLAAVASPQAAALAVVGMAVLGAAVMPLVPAGPPEVRPPARRPLDVVTGGIVVLLGHPVLRSSTVATTLAFVGLAGVPVAAVLLAGHVGAAETAGGQLVSAFAVGALAGSLSAARWLRPRHAEAVILAGLVGVGLSLAAAGAMPSLPLAMVCFALAGLCDGPVLAATLTLRQREAPADRLGQVNTTGGSLKLTAGAVGAVLVAALADHAGATGVLLGMGGAQLGGALLGVILLRIARR